MNIKLFRDKTAPEWWQKWVDMSEVEKTKDIEARCDKDFIQKELARRVETELGEIEVASVEINKSGEQLEPPLFEGFQEMHITGLPEYCHVLVKHRTHGNHVEHINVFIPLAWNERYIGLTAGGNRTGLVWDMSVLYNVPYCPSRVMCVKAALLNGFACGASDSANRDPRRIDWGIDVDTGELDWELILNWVNRCDHNAAVVGKAVTEIVHGRKIAYAYLVGNSGGGRETAMEAMCHPEDYDGYWADSPAINWNKFVSASIWAPVVMNNLNNVMPPAKFEAFRHAVIEKYGGKDGYYNRVDYPEFDAKEVVGVETEEGVITEKDAEVMQMIWDGPHMSDGKRLWYGFRPGCDSSQGVYVTRKVDDKWECVPFDIGTAIFQWLTRNAKFDWSKLSIEDYCRIVQQGIIDFGTLESDNPDLSFLRKLGKKFMLTHGIDDELISVDGSFDYYNRVVKEFGNKETVDEFFRFFPIPGDGHGFFDKNGSGMSTANGMVALMDWVERGIAPETIIGQHYDKESGTVSNVKYVKKY